MKDIFSQPFQWDKFLFLWPYSASLVIPQITCNIKDENKENHTYNGEETLTLICTMKDMSTRLQKRALKIQPWLQMRKWLSYVGEKLYFFYTTK